MPQHAVARPAASKPWPALAQGPSPSCAAVPGQPTEWSDPFTGGVQTPEAAQALLALWRDRAAENRIIAACLGMDRWKRNAIAAAFLREDGPPPFARSAEEAISLARNRPGGAVAAWATRIPPGFAEHCAAQEIPVLHVEDGFLRSVGLGVNFVTAASLCVDARGPHYDPRQPSTLETILAETDFAPDLLARARAGDA